MSVHIQCKYRFFGVLFWGVLLLLLFAKPFFGLQLIESTNTEPLIRSLTISQYTLSLEYSPLTSASVYNYQYKE